MINNNHTYIENYDICGNCYDLNIKSPYDINYFKLIDNQEKAYILGLFYFNLRDTSEIVIINNIKLSEDTLIIKLLKYFSYDLINSYSNTKCMHLLSFSLITDVINDIKFQLKNNFFNLTTDELKIAFIRGYYEGSFKNIEINENIKLLYDNDDNINKIIEFINIPYKNDKINKYIIYESGCNKVDFLGKIYQNSYKLRIKYYYYNIYNIPYCKIYKDDNNAIIPSKVRESDVGYDLTIIKENKRFNSKTVLYDTGIKIEIKNGYYVEIIPRSSLSKSGYILSNSIGIIDNSYRGNLLISLTKICDDAPDLILPFKCCQLIVRQQIYIDLYQVDEDLSITDRDEKGFGSSG